mmetsp:Transcript_30267/g.78283  ORF Transcript_30267/g.78283 Transcript_30267/m.78283 type:complete len:635 (-) Transcript_30267:604-2508(-)
MGLRTGFSRVHAPLARLIRVEHRCNGSFTAAENGNAQGATQAPPPAMSELGGNISPSQQASPLAVLLRSLAARSVGKDSSKNGRRSVVAPPMEQSAGIGEQLYPSCKERNFLPELRAAQVWSQAPRLSDRQRDALLEGLRTLGGLRNVVKHGAPSPVDGGQTVPVAAEKHGIRYCEESRRLRSVARAKGTYGFLDAARELRVSCEGQDWAGRAIASAVASIPNLQAAEAATLQAITEKLLQPQAASAAVTAILERHQQKSTSKEIIRVASKLIGTDSAGPHALPSNRTLQIILGAAGAIGDFGLVQALWTELSTALVHRSIPSRACSLAYLTAAVECDCRHAQRRGDSEVKAVLRPDSYAHQALQHLDADPYMKQPRLPPHAAARLMSRCAIPEEVDELLFCRLLNGHSEWAGYHEYHDESFIGGGVSAEHTEETPTPPLDLGWVPPPLDTEVAAAAIRVLMKQGASTAAWHVLWRSDSACSGPQAWRAIADETVQQGSALPALQAVYAASNRQISISQRTLQRLGLKLVACTNLNTVYSFWRKWLRQSPRTWRLQLVAVAESGLGDPQEMCHILRKGVKHIERQQRNNVATHLRRLVAAAVCASVTLRGQGWDARMNCLHACLHTAQVSGPRQ